MCILAALLLPFVRSEVVMAQRNENVTVVLELKSAITFQRMYVDPTTGRAHFIYASRGPQGVVDEVYHTAIRSDPAATRSVWPATLRD